MVNSGRSSTGCSACRRRKIKCDETRPGCKKCAQIGKECPGYPFSVQLELRSTQPVGTYLPLPATIFTPSESRYSPTPSATSSLASLDRHNSHSISPGACVREAPSVGSLLQVKKERGKSDKSTIDNFNQPARTITCAPRYDVQHQATCFFLNLFAYQATRKYGIPILDFLPDMLTKTNNNSAIYHAAKAVSRVTLADRYSGVDPRLQSGGEYASALNTIHVTMQNVNEATKDESVTAVWLLGLYEAVSSVLSHGRDPYDKSKVEDEWQSHVAHIRGAMRLLRLRGTKQFDNARSEKIFRIFKAAIQMRLFILNSVTSDDFDFLEVDAYRDDHEFVPSETANLSTTFFRNVAQHLEKTKQALRALSAQPTSLQSQYTVETLLKEGEALDLGMQGWSKNEQGWDIMNVQSSTKNSNWALHPNHAQYFVYSFWVFLYWIRYEIARVKLCESLIEILKAQLKLCNPNGVSQARIKDTNARIEKLIVNIRGATDVLIGFTAYALGDVTNTGAFRSAPSGLNPRGAWQEVNVVAAMQLVIPFKVLQRLPYLSPAQKGAVNLAIGHIADGFRRQPEMTPVI